jgi:hypothetical protein
VIKLYRSAIHLHHFVAYVEGSGWVIFPARENGWEERKPAAGLDPIYLRQISLSEASNTGLPGPAQPSKRRKAA